MRVILGADHRGFNLKNQIKRFLGATELMGFDDTKMEVLDAGAEMLDSNDDFVDYARKAVEIAEAANRENQSASEPSLLILVCQSGIGMSIAVNRFDGYRGALVWDEEGAFLARNDDDTNALCLPARLFNEDWSLCQRIITRWLTTPFSGDDRFRRRNAKLDKIREEAVWQS